MTDKYFTTDRLILKKLTLENSDFMKELVNTPGWIQFIGDRNIHTLEAAQNYIQRIMDNENMAYWVVYLKDKHLPIGVISLIKREYLDYADLGFAFLPTQMGHGYAQEATYSVLQYFINLPKYTTLAAIVNEANTRSINVLKRLGYQYKKTIIENKETLDLYEITTDGFILNELYQHYF